MQDEAQIRETIIQGVRDELTRRELPGAADNVRIALEVRKGELRRVHVYVYNRDEPQPGRGTP